MRYVTDVAEAEVIGFEEAAFPWPVVDECRATTLVTTDGTDGSRSILYEEVEGSLLVGDWQLSQHLLWTDLGQKQNLETC